MIHLLFILLSTLTLAQNVTFDEHTNVYDEEYTPPPQVCYQFKKEDFNHTSNITDDLIFDITSKEYIGFKFSSSRKSFSGHYGKFFECMKQESNHFECSRWDSIEKMHYYMQDDTMYLHIDYLQVSMEDDSVIYNIKSKDSNFVNGSLSPCYLPMEPVIAVNNVKKGSPKEKLLQSINLNDVVIYDLDYYKEFAIAVGEDNSPKTRELQSRDEHHEAVILRSTNGGKAWERVGQIMSIPHDHVIVLDAKQIIIASSIEGAGGEILVSSDGGINWKNTYSGGMIETLKQQDNEIIMTDIMGSQFKSKDGGMSWHETVSLPQDEHEEEAEETQVQQNSDEDHQLTFLTSPEYRINYETNTLIVQQRKNNCDVLSLALVYNQSNQRKSILGRYWSLGGIESQITRKNDNELIFFNSYKGKEKRYYRGKDNRKFFYHKGSSKIEETKEGYLIKCDRSTHHFNKEGYLIKIIYAKRSYTMHYENNKLQQIIENRDDTQHPFISFSYPYEGLSITFHNTKESKDITFIKNGEQLLSSIVKGNRHMYHYTYSEKSQGNHRLTEIKDMTKPYADRTLLKFEFDYYRNDTLTVYDFTQKQNGYTKEKKYYHHPKDTSLMCIVNTLTKYFENKKLTDVSSDIDTYSFSYFDKDKKRLAWTRHDKKTYGFDEIGRVNFYGDEDGNVSVKYSQFNKIENSLVYKDVQPFNYTYLYTDDNNHYLRKVIAPEEEIELTYNGQGLIKELKTNKYHLLIEYDKNHRTTKIILPRKGEIITHYDSKTGELDTIDTLSYDKNINDIALSYDVSDAMQTLKRRVSEGSIKSYPDWIW